MESILLEDNPHWEKEGAYDHFIRREALDKAQTLLAAKEVIAIIGARRVGKSTLETGGESCMNHVATLNFTVMLSKIWGPPLSFTVLTGAKERCGISGKTEKWIFMMSAQ